MTSEKQNLTECKEKRNKDIKTVFFLKIGIERMLFMASFWDAGYLYQAVSNNLDKDVSLNEEWLQIRRLEVTATQLFGMVLLHVM